MKFDRVYKELLKELFNTKQETEWSFYDGGYSTILEGPDGTTYVLSLAPFYEVELPAELFNIKQLTPENWKTLQKGAWHVEFVSEHDEGSVDITGDKGINASKVFGLIGNALLDKVKSNPNEFRSIVFSAKEKSRRSLYLRLAPILAKKLNKQLIVSSDNEWFFILSKS